MSCHASDYQNDVHGKKASVSSQRTKLAAGSVSREIVIAGLSIVGPWATGRETAVR